jgi:hypothetical protein
MKNVLKVLGLMIILTAIKAIAWISEHGAPPMELPTTTGDIVGIVFVAILVISFVSCLLWYLIKGEGK